MRRFVVTAVIIASACGVFGGREIWAENTTSHAVQKGDTLWELSGGYLNDPLLWPKIWKFNPGIANPHRIKPGQLVKIPGIKKTSVKDASAGIPVGPVESEYSPLARAGLASSAEPLPLIVVKNDLPLAGGQQAKANLGSDPAQYYDRGIGMVTNDIPREGRVLRSEHGWQGAAFGETIFISAPGAQVGQQFGVYRDMGKVESLDYFSKSPGHLLADIAIVEVVASDASRQQAVIRRAFAEVRTDDVLGQVSERPTVAARPQVRTSSVKGAVVAFHMMRQLAGPDDILYVNIGADQGLAPGDLLSVAGKEEQSEGRTSGEIMILRVSATTAAAVVTKRSGHEVYLGDVVGLPGL